MNEHQIKQAEEQLQLVAMYKTVFGTPEGKKVLEHLMKVHGVLDSNFDPNPHTMAFLEGRRHVVISIMKNCEHDLHQLRDMISTLQKQRVEEAYVE